MVCLSSKHPRTGQQGWGMGVTARGFTKVLAGGKSCQRWWGNVWVGRTFHRFGLEVGLPAGAGHQSDRYRYSADSDWG